MSIQRVDFVNNVNNRNKKNREFNNNKNVNTVDNDFNVEKSNYLYIEDIIKLYESVPITENVKYKLVGYIECKVKSNVFANNVTYLLIEYQGLDYIIDTRDLKKKQINISDLNKSNVTHEINSTNLTNYNKMIRKNNLNKIKNNFI